MISHGLLILHELLISHGLLMLHELLIVIYYSTIKFNGKYFSAEAGTGNTKKHYQRRKNGEILFGGESLYFQTRRFPNP